MKLPTILLFTSLASSSCLLATGLSFQTLSPVVGDILKADNSTALSDGALFRFGTVSSNDFTGFTTITQYESVFTQLGSNTFSSGEVTGSLTAGTVAEGVELYGIVYAGGSTSDAESAFFLIGETPALSVLSGAPSTSTVFYGTKTGNNINLSLVPEPAAFATLAGILALGSVMLRRRR